MKRFSSIRADGSVLVSIKVRVVSGCFHREHSSEAYRLIDYYLANEDLSDIYFEFEEHESGPEILVYLTLTAAGLNFAKSVIDLITAVIKARSDGIKRGDQPSEPLELIVRGYAKDREYFEETVLKIPAEHMATSKEVKDALAKAKLSAQKKKRKKK